MKRSTALILVVFALSGCTATQLRYQTLNEANTVESLSERQVLYNLSLFETNPYAIPSQVTVTTGSASTTNSVSPTFMTPLGTATVISSQLANSATSGLSTALASTTTNSVATAVANTASSTTTTGGSTMNTLTNGTMTAIGTTNSTTTAMGGSTTNGGSTTVTTNSSNAAATGTSTSLANGTTTGTTTTTTNGTTGGTTTTNTTGNTNGLTTSSQTTHPNKTLSLALSDNWSESWTLEPVTDSDALRRLSALYRFILGKSDVSQNAQGRLEKAEAQFMCDYPLATPDKTTAPTPTGNLTTTLTADPDNHTIQTITKSGNDAKDTGNVVLVFRCQSTEPGVYKIRTAKVNRSLLRLPECVICIDENAADLAARAARTAYKHSAAAAALDEETDQATTQVNQLVTQWENAKKTLDLAEQALVSSQNRINDLALDPQIRQSETDALQEKQRARDNAREAVAHSSAALAGVPPATLASLAKTSQARQQIEENEVLIADAGAFSRKAYGRDGNDNQPETPFLNPALVFGLVRTAKLDCKDRLKCDIGSYGRYHFYGDKTRFHEFELLVNSAAVAGTPVSGVAIRTSPTEVLIQ